MDIYKINTPEELIAGNSYVGRGIVLGRTPDGGRILLQKAVPVLPGDTPAALQKRVMERAEWIILPEAAELVSSKIVKEKEYRQ